LQFAWANIWTQQREISVAADVAALAYKDATPMNQRTAVGIWKAMTLAEEKARKSIRTKSFEKYVAVANSHHETAFFDEVILSLLSSLSLLHSTSTFLSIFLTMGLVSRLIGTSPPTLSLT
jgi:hypothetical protein